MRFSQNESKFPRFWIIFDMKMTGNILLGHVLEFLFEENPQKISFETFR